MPIYIANLYAADLSSASLSIEELASRPRKSSDDSDPEVEFNRLVAAAVVSSKFCQLLLTNPAQAIEAGYQKEKFTFSESERQLLLSIKAKSLEEFCLKLIALLRPSQNQP